MPSSGPTALVALKGRSHPLYVPKERSGVERSGEELINIRKNSTGKEMNDRSKSCHSRAIKRNKYHSMLPV